MISRNWLQFLHSHVSDTKSKREREVEELDKTIAEAERKKGFLVAEIETDAATLAWITVQLQSITP